MLPNDVATVKAVLAALDDKTTSSSNLEKLAAVGVIYMRYLAQHQLASLAQQPPTPPTA